MHFPRAYCLYTLEVVFAIFPLRAGAGINVIHIHGLNMESYIMVYIPYPSALVLPSTLGIDIL